MDLLYLLRKLHGIFYRVCKSYSQWKRKRHWNKEAERMRILVTPTPQIELDMEASFLILMPHSDDEWIGCSQIIKKGKVVIICNMNMSGGDSEEVHSIRYMEAQQMANDFIRDFITLSSSNPIKELATVIGQYTPDYIMLPYFFDWHLEHNDVMKICYRGLNECDYGGKFLLYQVSVPIPAYDCNCCLAMNRKDCDEKWSLFCHYYKSQSFMPVARFQAYERINGSHTKSYAAEAFCYIGVKEWKEGFENKLLNDNEKYNLKTNLNDVVFMIKEVNRLYEIRHLKSDDK